MLEGLSPDVPIVTNEKGAMQSATPYRFDLLDAKSMFKLAEVLAYGATRYAPDNWRGISASDHYNHLMQHLFAWKAGDTQDDHLGHALCRAMMLCAVVEAEKSSSVERLRELGVPDGLFEARCADCGMPAQVPFQPQDDRPLYCRECFEARRRREEHP
jgi:CxxC-x17-CxxC domain-containing protein